MLEEPPFAKATEGKREKKFKDKYRINSVRHPIWDYADDGMYFVTICTQDRIKYFGNIVGEKMVLNSVGEIVVEE